MRTEEPPPTPLVRMAERAPVIILPPPGKSHFRGLLLICLLARQLLLGLGYWVCGQLTDANKGFLLVQILERMGYLWVKIGEMMAKRTDLYSDDFCREFSKVCYRSQGFPIEMVRKTVQNELGRPLEALFKEFDPLPFRAMSICQTHRAVLAGSNDWVAVKVQLPGIQAMFERDLTLIRRLIAVFKWLGIQKHLRWDSILWELNQVTTTAVDYRYEAANLRQMRKILRPQRIVVPRVVDRLSTERVLVTEFIHGALMSDVIELTNVDPSHLQEWLKENGISLRRLGRRLFVFMLRLLMEENVTPGELHPSNIVLLRNSRIAFVDLGVANAIEADFLNKYIHAIRALSQAQYNKAADLMLLLCPDLPVIDLPEVRTQMVHCFRAWSARAELKRMPYSEKSLASMFRDLSRIMAARNIVPRTTFMNLNHIWGTLDVSLSYLIPDANYNRLFKKYFYGASQRSLRSALTRKSIVTAVSGLRHSLAEYQQIAGTALRRGALVFQGGRTKVSDAMATLLKLVRFGLLGCIVVFTLTLLELKFDNGLAWLPFSDRLIKLIAIAPTFDFDLLVIMLFVSAYAYWTLGSLRKRFRQKEIRLPGRATSN